MQGSLLADPLNTLLSRVSVVCRREIAVLQTENYSLERQLFSYQKSLAYAQAQAGEGEGGAEARVAPAQSPERSLSTDTEYA